VYHFKEESQEWEEFLKPMPTAKCVLTIATTQSAIIVSGGVTDIKDGNPLVCVIVEVYSNESSQWHTADPMPAPYYGTSTVTIADTCYMYLLGGWDADNKAITSVLCVSITSLVQKATSPTHQSASHTSVWKTLPDTPLKVSAAASLSGHLLSMGGRDSSIRLTTSAIHVFFPFTNSWVRVTSGNLPEPRYSFTAVQLSVNTMIVIGGRDN